MLKGDNLIDVFRKTAEDLSKDLMRVESVVGIIFHGGLTRGYVDRFSDIDIDVIIEKEDNDVRESIYGIASQHSRRTGLDIDLSVLSLRHFLEKEFDDSAKWDYSRAIVRYDPKGIIQKILTEKIAIRREELVKRIVENSLYLQWYCCPVNEEELSISEAWISRGDPVSAHYALNHSIELMLNLLYALNRRHTPPAKWRVFYSYKLPWKPKMYEKLLKDALRIEDFSYEDLKRRLSALRKLANDLMHKAEAETGIRVEDFLKYYVTNILQIRNIPFSKADSHQRITT